MELPKEADGRQRVEGLEGGAQGNGRHSWDYPGPGAASLSLLFQFKLQKSLGLCMLVLSPDEETGFTEANSWTKVLQLLSEVPENLVSEADPELSAQISELGPTFVLNERRP